MGLLLGLSTLYYSLRSPSSPILRQESLRVAVILASLYWVTQLSAILYPGSLAVDPEFGDGFPQAYFCVGLLSMVGVGALLELRSVGSDRVGMR